MCKQLLKNTLFEEFRVGDRVLQRHRRQFVKKPQSRDDRTEVEKHDEAPSYSLRFSLIDLTVKTNLLLSF